MNGSLQVNLSRYRPDAVETVAIVGMLALVFGSTLEEGTAVQRSLFLVATIVLLAVAYVTDEKMLTTLEIVLLLGSVMAFVPALSLELRMVILLGAAVIGVAYLYSIDYREKDQYWPIGGVGLLLIAGGFAISDLNILAFNGFLAIGSLVVAAYSSLGFFVRGVRIQSIWIVLNLAFAVTPGLRIVELLS